MKTKFARYLMTFCLVAVLAAGSAHAATITVINNDGAGEGFNDPTAVAQVGGNYGTTVGQQRLIAFQYAANIWAACLQSSVTIRVAAQMNPLTCTASSAVLGSAGTTEVFRDFAGAPLAATWYPKALAAALLGFDPDPATADISAQFNSNIGNAGCLTGIFWYYGLDGNAPAGTIDFVSVVTHEIGHGLGFQTFENQAGGRLGGFSDDYMAFLENHGAVPADFPSMTDAQRAAANIADPNLHWSGPLVTAKGLAILSAGTSAGHVRMHGPNPYQGGSSVSHWSTALSPDQLMEPVYTGPNHDPGLAWTLMDEIGWTLVNKVTDGCDGAVLNLASPSGPPTGGGGGLPDSFQDRGAYVTALKDFNLCSLGVEANLIPGENITASVYAATGLARGALIASFTTKVEFAGLVTHHIPLSVTLQACKEYDIVVHWDHVTSWPFWSEPVITEPYDIGGVIRVRDGELNGGAGNTVIGHFTLQGSAVGPHDTAILQNSVFTTCTDGSTDRGTFITAARTISVCSIGFESNYSAAPVALTANIYNASGLVRGSLLATGTLTSASAGLQFRNIPINAVLQEGRDYEIQVLYPVALSWGCFIEGPAPVPYTVGGAITVVNGTFTGNPANTAIPHLSVSWNDGPGLHAYDITSPYLGPPSGSSTVHNFAFGKYVTAVNRQELTSLGWYADIPPGQTVVAHVYNATGTVRGTLVSTGTIVTGPAGLRWHDIPVSATLVAGQNYDLEVDWTAVGVVNSFPYWGGVGATQPYTVNGNLTVIVGEIGGAPDAAQECAQYRVFSCPTSALTAVGPAQTPKFTLSEAFPNPFSGSARLAYTLDEASAVSVAIYDVAGRKVAEVMRSKSMPAGHGQLNIDAGRLASGVYFVKLSTPSKSVTRKITIIR
jgi:hypothetical protein